MVCRLFMFISPEFNLIIGFWSHALQSPVQLPKLYHDLVIWMVLLAICIFVDEVVVIPRYGKWRLEIQEIYYCAFLVPTEVLWLLLAYKPAHSTVQGCMTCRCAYGTINSFWTFLDTVVIKILGKVDIHVLMGCPWPWTVGFSFHGCGQNYFFSKNKTWTHASNNTTKP